MMGWELCPSKPPPRLYCCTATVDVATPRRWLFTSGRRGLGSNTRSLLSTRSHPRGAPTPLWRAPAHHQVPLGWAQRPNPKNSWPVCGWASLSWGKTLREEEGQEAPGREKPGVPQGRTETRSPSPSLPDSEWALQSETFFVQSKARKQQRERKIH